MLTVTFTPTAGSGGTQASAITLKKKLNVRAPALGRYGKATAASGVATRKLKLSSM